MDYRVGTFSRVFSVSLHLGYLIMPLAQIEGFAETLSKFGLRAALPCQRALLSMLATILDSDRQDMHR